MEFNKKGILGRAKEAAQQSTAVTDEGLRAYMLKAVSYTHLTLPTKRIV